MKDLFRVEEINPCLVRITDVADTHFYLIRGDRKAALLDTGVGCGDLRSLVEKLTDKPLIVLITHGHIDHAMGAGQFENVYMSPEDREIYEEHSTVDMRLSYIHGTFMSREGNPETAFVTAEMLQEPKPFDDFKSLSEGDSFDLGGITIRVLEGTGHTPGCKTLLLPELRILLTGDACNPCVFLFDHGCSTVAEYREMLIRLKKTAEGSYDRILLNHNLELEEPSLIDSVIDVCDDILNGNTDDEPSTGFHGEPVCLAKAMTIDPESGVFSRVDGKIGNIIYNPARVR